METEFFENVLKNLNGRTIKEMSMLGQVSDWLILNNDRNNLGPWDRMPVCVLDSFV